MSKNAKSKAWRPSKEKSAVYNARRIAKDPKAHRARARAYDASHREQRKHRSLINRYGISLRQREAMERKQNFRCAICQEETLLMVDHEHTTGRVRKLLCRCCNSGLGMFKDNPYLLLAARVYLTEGDDDAE